MVDPDGGTVYVHSIKTVPFFDRGVKILAQNENGPCPLLALCNVLLLRGSIEIPSRFVDTITSEHLVSLVANHLMESNPPIENDAAAAANQAQTISDIISILPKLQRGMDVNVKFSGISHFEFNDYVSIFDMLDVNLFHGWLVDPQAADTAPVVGKLSYNQLVEKVIGGGGSGDNGNRDATRTVIEAEVCRAFLEETKSQLTYHGLMELHEKVRERQLCVFFRNNHFSTMFKLEGSIYLLLTDLGYVKRNQCAWESLGDIDGNTEILSPSFGDPNEYCKFQIGSGEDDDVDRMLALQLQREEERGDAHKGIMAGQVVGESSLSPQERYAAETARYNAQRSEYERLQREAKKSKESSCTIS